MNMKKIYIVLTIIVGLLMTTAVGVTIAINSDIFDKEEMKFGSNADVIDLNDSNIDNVAIIQDSSANSETDSVKSDINDNNIEPKDDEDLSVGSAKIVEYKPSIASNPKIIGFPNQSGISNNSNTESGTATVANSPSNINTESGTTNNQNSTNNNKENANQSSKPQDSDNDSSKESAKEDNNLDKADIEKEQSANSETNETDEDTVNQEEHIHDFSLKVVSDEYLKSNATCIAASKYYYSCECGEYDVNKIFEEGEALGHEWDEGSLVKEASLYDDGVIEYKCTHSGCLETKEENIPKLISSVQVGDVITFGKYEQDNDLSNGQEPIEWQVLSVDDEKIFVVSKYVLDSVKYNDSNVLVTWKDCSLRTWLNNDFMSAAFSDDEQNKICLAPIENEDNPMFEEDGGEDTEDKVFLLSVKEMEEFFGDEYKPCFDKYNGESRGRFNVNYLCEATPYAQNLPVDSLYNWTITSSQIGSRGYPESAIGTKATSWWLRTIGDADTEHNCYSACYASYEGDAGYGHYQQVNIGKWGVRPAMYLFVSEHEHEWDEGTILRRPSTFTEGACLYNCTHYGCDATKTESIPALNQDIEVGSFVTLGEYEQDNDLSNGKEPIEWQVLSIEDGRIFVVSKYVLDSVKYNDSNVLVTWKDCSLRTWLNNDFMNAAFSEDEQNKICLTTIENEDNPMFEEDGGEDTEDKVFLLSVKEMEEFFGDEYKPCFDKYNGESRGRFNVNYLCEATPYAQNLPVDSLYNWTITSSQIGSRGYPESAIGTKATSWWLRTIGDADTEHNCYSACYASYEGDAGYGHYQQVNIGKWGVRPAMYISIE